MKKLLCIILLFVAVHSYGQYNLETNEQQTSPKTYISLGTGLNQIGFLGAGFESGLTSEVALAGTVGLGGWGWKFNGTLRYYPGGYPARSAIGLGFGYAVGADKVEADLPTGTNSQTETVELELKPSQTLNFTYTYYWMIKNKNRFYLEAGYALPLSDKPYSAIRSDYVFSKEAEFFLNMMQPGGIMFGLGIHFGGK